MKIGKLYLCKRVLSFLMILVIISLLMIPSQASANNKLPYYIKVNKQQNTLTIYGLDSKGKYTVPIKAMTCTVGKATPLGTFKTPIKYRWKLLNNNVWGQYSTRIVGSILFHSVWYYKQDPSTLSWEQYNKLGTTASQGCVRLTVEDAKWIYDNCPIGTTVEIYESKDPGPLGKPETLKLKKGTGWDPTDLDPKNPFLKLGPTLEGLASKVVLYGTTFDPMEGVKALSTSSNDITKKIIVTGKVNTKKVGSYDLVYEVTDAINRSIKKEITIDVIKSTEAPYFTGVEDRYISKDTVVNKKYALENVKAYEELIEIPSTDIKVSIVKTTKDEYQITYAVTGSSDITTKKTIKYMVDSEIPFLEGGAYKELTFTEWMMDTKELEELVRKDMIVTDNVSKISSKDIKVKVTTKENYVYSVDYSVADEVGNKRDGYMELVYFSNTKIQGLKNSYDLESDTVVNEGFVLDGVQAFDSDGKDRTKDIKISIDKKDEKTYYVTYTIKNEVDEIINLSSVFHIQ